MIFKMALKFSLLLPAFAFGPSLPAGAQEAAAPAAVSKRFERADADRSGDVSLSEFAAANDRYVGGADADGDGRMTAGEIADEISRVRTERLAQRIVKRLDADGDGAVSRAELEAGQKASFDRLDRNQDGKLTADEMPAPRARQPKG